VLKIIGFTRAWQYSPRSALLFAASVSYSQEAIESQEVEADSSDSEQVTSSVEEVVVTGSRLKRSTFTLAFLLCRLLLQRFRARSGIVERCRNFADVYLSRAASS
jgi:hypothetical protein